MNETDKSNPDRRIRLPKTSVDKSSYDLIINGVNVSSLNRAYEEELLRLRNEFINEVLELLRNDNEVQEIIPCVDNGFQNPSLEQLANWLENRLKKEG